MRKYTSDNETINNIAFPLGGFGAGMICINGWGGFESLSVRHRPEKWFSPNMWSALTFLDGDRTYARTLEGPVPKIQYYTNVPDANRAFQVGMHGKTYGLPRFSKCEFTGKFPFAEIKLTDETLPVDVTVSAWSPFVPGKIDESSLPFAALEYSIKNKTDKALDLIYSFSSFNFVNYGVNPVLVENGFAFEKTDGFKEAWAFAFSADSADVDTCWYRSNWWFDNQTVQWNRVASGDLKPHAYKEPDKGASPGASLSVPLHLEAGQEKKVVLRMCWYAPDFGLRIGMDDMGKTPEETRALESYQPWYTNRFSGIVDAATAWKGEYNHLYEESKLFSDTLFKTDLPEEIVDAVSSNLSVLKSPTVLRQRDGRMWAWEGCNDIEGSCHGSCTHVWNYAQAICHLFPDMEQSLRETEFFMDQDEEGHQEFRAYLPIRKAGHNFFAAADGQLGGIIKSYREWKLSGDNKWIRKMWPQMVGSMEYCINEWDPHREGATKQPHHNTYDIEFYGADSLTMSFYISALKAMSEIAEALGEDGKDYKGLYEKARKFFEGELYNGEYFFQKVEVVPDIKPSRFKPLCYTAPEDLADEVKALIEKQGPPYQYGTGCLADQLLGIWLGELAGLSDIVDEDKVTQALASIYKYNFRTEFADHSVTQRPGYIAHDEAGLLLCRWPHGGKPELPFVYSDEAWTGIEYQVAGHLIMKGKVKEGLDIVKAARGRFEGKFRNPFSEYECGEWYGRSLASYGLLEAYTGISYDGRTGVLKVSSKNSKEFKCFFCQGDCYGIVSLKDGKASYEPVRGELEISRIVVL